MPTEQRPPVSRRKLGIFGVVALIGAGLIVATGIRAREESGSKLREWTDNQAIPTVAVAFPNARALNPTIDLPGRLEAYSRAPIFARVSGYLKSWSADIGARVKAGQVIAEIEAPDLDQQLLQARADLTSQQSSAKLSEATLTRRKSLLASNFVSMQEIDERSADLANKKAAVNSGQANVERLEALAGYKKITAPFDGVVTARDTDVGAARAGRVRSRRRGGAGRPGSAPAPARRLGRGRRAHLGPGAARRTRRRHHRRVTATAARRRSLRHRRSSDHNSREGAGSKPDSRSRRRQSVETSSASLLLWSSDPATRPPERPPGIRQSGGPPLE